MLAHITIVAVYHGDEVRPPRARTFAHHLGAMGRELAYNKLVMALVVGEHNCLLMVGRMYVDNSVGAPFFFYVDDNIFFGNLVDGLRGNWHWCRSGSTAERSKIKRTLEPRNLFRRQRIHGGRTRGRLVWLVRICQ